VTPDVLIPRPETETLVEAILDLWARAGLKEPVFLDVGTGSGCIAVTLLTHVPGARAVATDVSAAALNVAALNAERHGVSGRLTCAHADRLDLAADLIPNGGFDALLSNPPYVAADDIETLDVAVRKYEPMQALSDGADGLSFFRCLAEEAPRLLKPNGVLVVEIADGREMEVREIVRRSGRLVHRSTLKDRVVGRERIIVFERPAR
jgi:release factor glutamine methyltransferase